MGSFGLVIVCIVLSIKWGPRLESPSVSPPADAEQRLQEDQERLERQVKESTKALESARKVGQELLEDVKMGPAGAFETTPKATARPRPDRKKNRLPAASEAILQRAEQVEVLSLICPDPVDILPEADEFHGYCIRRKASTLGARARKELLAALREGMDKSNGTREPVRKGAIYGLRVTQAGKTVDFILHFEAGAVDVYAEGKQVACGLTITSSLEPVFAKVLTEARAPMGKESSDR